MTQKIESLTAEQIAKFPAYVEKWTKIGLSTEPVDLEPAVEAAKLAYRIAELPEPEKFYTAKGPLDAIELIKKLDPEKTESTIIYEMVYGNHEASWLSFYEFFRNELNIEECKKLDGFFELAKHCGWLNMYDEAVVFHDRPEFIKFDDQNRLHNEFGPAIRFRDGFSVYSWHGTRIPAEWIEEKHKLTAEIALTWEQIEQRRCACEILGWNKILKSLNAITINEDPDPEIGVLVEVEIPDIGKQKFLRVLCGTKREFALPVPPEMKTALEANSWTFGFDVADFIKPEIRT